MIGAVTPASFTTCSERLSRRKTKLAPLSSYQLAERLRKGFDAATLRDPMAGSSVYAGIAELLADVGASRPLVVVTNKPTTLARAVLAEAGLLHHFESVHGADMAAQRKPSPLMLRQACANLGIATGHLLMVGDAAVDIACARAAGSAAAWAGWGYGQLPAHASADVWRLAMPQELLQRLALPAGAHIAP
jgi:phosphoglycolate phosphatase